MNKKCSSTKRQKIFLFQDSPEPDPSSPPFMTGGGVSATPLLDFQLRPLGARRNWKNALNKQRFDATIQQHRDPTNREDLGLEVTDALRRAIERQIANDDTLTPHSTVHFTMQSDTFTHAFQSTTFSVREFREGSARLDTYLQALAAKLNSNEEFAPDDSFTMEMTFIHTPGPGSSNSKRYKASDAAILGITKKSTVTIKNDDELCCARAIVTMKAYVDANHDSRDPDYKNLQRGLPSKNVGLRNSTDWLVSPKGPVGYPNWKNFKLLYLIIASKSSHAPPRIKSFSMVHPLVLRSYASSKPMITTMDVIPSKGSCQPLISVTIAIGGTITMTSNIIRARENGVVHVNVKIALTSWLPNKLAVLETIPNLKNSVVSVIENSTVRNVTITIFNVETETKHAPSVT